MIKEIQTQDGIVKVTSFLKFWLENESIVEFLKNTSFFICVYKQILDSSLSCYFGHLMKVLNKDPSVAFDYIIRKLVIKN